MPRETGALKYLISIAESLPSSVGLFKWRRGFTGLRCLSLWRRLALRHRLLPLLHLRWRLPLRRWLLVVLLRWRLPLRCWLLVVLLRRRLPLRLRSRLLPLLLLWRLALRLLLWCLTLRHRLLSLLLRRRCLALWHRLPFTRLLVVHLPSARLWVIVHLLPSTRLCIASRVLPSAGLLVVVHLLPSAGLLCIVNGLSSSPGRGQPLHILPELRLPACTYSRGRLRAAAYLPWRLYYVCGACGRFTTPVHNGAVHGHAITAYSRSSRRAGTRNTVHLHRSVGIPFYDVSFRAVVITHMGAVVYIVVIDDSSLVYIGGIVARPSPVRIAIGFVHILRRHEYPPTVGTTGVTY